MVALQTLKFHELLLAGTLNLSSADLRVLLFDQSHVPAVTDDFVDVITGGTSKEIGGTGYTAGWGSSSRLLVAGRVVTRSDSGLYVCLNADPSLWAGIDAGTIGGAAVFMNASDDPSSPLLAEFQFVDDAVATDGSPVQIDWPADGLLKFSLAAA